MKLWIEIDYEIDGEATMDQIVKAATELINTSVVLSEDIGDGEDYALIVNSIEILIERPS